jgi:hypothetical protein
MPLSSLVLWALWNCLISFFEGWFPLTLINFHLSPFGNFGSNVPSSTFVSWSVMVVVFILKEWLAFSSFSLKNS